jgi:hypothetical protein
VWKEGDEGMGEDTRSFEGRGFESRTMVHGRGELREMLEWGEPLVAVRRAGRGDGRGSYRC